MWTHRKVNFINAFLAFLAGFALGVWVPCAFGREASCYPGVAPTADKPNIPHPKDYPYVTYRTWGAGAYWYCLDPATGKWAGEYSILVYGDIAAVLKQGETLDAVARALKDQFDAAKTPSEKRAVINAAIERFRAPWISCRNAIDKNIEPQRWYCLDIEATTCGRDTPPGERCRAMPADISPAPTPAPAAWVVAPTTVCAASDKDSAGRCVRRQTYVWANGARGAAASEKVDIGSACDASVGSAGFYGVLGRSDRVAPCVKR